MAIVITALTGSLCFSGQAFAEEAQKKTIQCKG